MYTHPHTQSHVQAGDTHTIHTHHSHTLTVHVHTHTHSQLHTRTQLGDLVGALKGRMADSNKNLMAQALALTGTVNYWKSMSQDLIY